MLTEPVARCETWQQRYPRETPLTISVNVSTKQLPTGDSPSRCNGCSRRPAFPPGTLTLEITESALMQNLKAGATVIKQLHDLTVGCTSTISGPAIRLCPTCTTSPSTR